MPIREFRDAAGTAWKVWETTPDDLHPVTRGEDYMQTLGSGWLTFERTDGGEKRRLHPIPGDWENADETKLDLLRRAAERVRSDTGQGRKYALGAPASNAADVAAQPAAEVADSPGECSSVRRSFLYPGGRFWSVCEMRITRHDVKGGARIVLRFTAGARQLDLATWPADWGEYTDGQLVDLLRRAFPREVAAQNASGYARRFGDARP